MNKSSKVLRFRASDSLMVTTTVLYYLACLVNYFKTHRVIFSEITLLQIRVHALKDGNCSTSISKLCKWSSVCLF